MNNSDKGDFYFGISENKVFICFFEKKKDYLKNYIDFEIPETLNNNLNFKIISNLLKNNIRKLEKSLGIFLTNGNVSIKSKTTAIFSGSFGFFLRHLPILWIDSSLDLSDAIKITFFKPFISIPCDNLWHVIKQSKSPFAK